MTTRYVIWHVPHPGAETPSYYVDRDCEPVALRLYASTPPNGGDMVVDVLDDGVSLMNSNDAQVVTFKDEDANIEFGTPSGTFTVNEQIDGGSSSASAMVKKVELGRLTLRDCSSTAFTVGETITGASSGATGVVNAYVKQVKNNTRATISGQSRAVLPENKNSSEAAQDFVDRAWVDEGSWLSVSVLEYNGAQNITIQLELEELGESVEKRLE